MKMDVPDEQENRCDTISTEGRKPSVLSSDNERDMQGHSQLVGENAIILETHAEGLEPEKHRLREYLRQISAVMGKTERRKHTSLNRH